MWWLFISICLCFISRCTCSLYHPYFALNISLFFFCLDDTLLWFFSRFKVIHGCFCHFFPSPEKQKCCCSSFVIFLSIQKDLCCYCSIFFIWEAILFFLFFLFSLFLSLLDYLNASVLWEYEYGHESLASFSLKKWQSAPEQWLSGAQIMSEPLFSNVLVKFCWNFKNHFEEMKTKAKDEISRR